LELVLNNHLDSITMVMAAIGTAIYSVTC